MYHLDYAAREDIKKLYDYMYSNATTFLTRKEIKAAKFIRSLQAYV